MRSSLSLVVALIVSSAPAFAQSAASTPRYDVAAGYAFMRDQDIATSNPDISANFPAGWMVSAGATLSQWLGAAGQVSGSYKTVAIPGDRPKLRVYTFLAGPRVKRAYGRISPFGQVLFGAAHASTSLLTVTDTTTNFAYQPGAGVDARLSERLGLRLQGDYRVIRADRAISKEPGVALAAVIGS